jgi:hypothetical protein
MAINKAQGQIFNKIGIDLRKQVFTHSRLQRIIAGARICQKIIDVAG